MAIALSIAALIVAIAFAVLVVYLSQTLKSTQRTLDNVAGTLAGLEKQMNGITTETTELLKRKNQLADDIQEKSLKLNGVFDGIKGIGDTIKDFNESLAKISSNITTAASKDQDKTSQAVKWGIAILDIIKNKRKK